MLSYCYKKPAGSIISGLFLGFFLAFSSSTIAQPASPFLTRNQSPLSLIYGIPYASPARLLDQHKSRWISSLNISNTLIEQKGTNDQLFVDLETWQLNLFYDYGLNENWMFRVQVPLIAHSGGIFDSIIDTYHQTLGLPEGLQPNLPYDQITINFSQNNVNQISITNSTKDLGDIALQFAWQTTKLNNMAISYWGSLKLPTGDYRNLTGSGGTDISIWAAMDYQLKNTRWLYGHAGLLYMHNNKVLKDIHNDWAAFASTGIKFQPWNSVELKAQLELQSAIFDTDIKFMGHVYQLTFGGSYLINKKQQLDFAVAEDIRPGASPDVNFNISWWINF